MDREQVFDPEILADLGQRKQLNDMVYEALRAGIIAGKIPAGEWLRQEDISQELNVSHTPVRQALERLVAEGLAERVPYKGVRVTEFTPEEIAEIYALRLLFEPIIARSAVSEIDNSDLDQLAEIIERAQSMTSLDQMSARRQMNLRFHSIIGHKSRNLLLYRLWQMALNGFPDWRIYEGMFRQVDSLQGRLEREIDEHQQILDALRERDADRLGHMMLEHILNLKSELVELLGVPWDLVQEKWETLAPSMELYDLELPD